MFKIRIIICYPQLTIAAEEWKKASSPISVLLRREKIIILNGLYINKKESYSR
jgi:hypothetical protein